MNNKHLRNGGVGTTRKLKPPQALLADKLFDP